MVSLVGTIGRLVNLPQRMNGLMTRFVRGVVFLGELWNTGIAGVI